MIKWDQPIVTPMIGFVGHIPEELFIWVQDSFYVILLTRYVTGLTLRNGVDIWPHGNCLKVFVMVL